MSSYPPWKFLDGKSLMAPAAKLQLADRLALPVEVVTKRLGFLGQSESGKTYAAMKLAELLLRVGVQVVVLDPVGPWWGLRAAADGERPGIPIPVLGGVHGDVEMTPNAGAAVADLIVDGGGLSAVVDISDFTIGQTHRFVSDFAERFFERKKRSPSPVHLFLEEAQSFAPQVLPPDPGAAIMLGRVARIVKVGRNHGIGTSLISQAPQAVAKSCLNQIDCLFAMRTIGKHERKAIKDWFGDHTRDGDDAGLDERLRSLDTGNAYAVSTSWLKVAQVVRIAEKETFDSSATPKVGEPQRVPKVLARVDAEPLRAALAQVQAEAEQNDPRMLHRQIAELKKQAAARPAAAPAPPPKVERVEVPVIHDDQVRAFGEIVHRLTHALDDAAAIVVPLLTALEAATKARRAAPRSPTPAAVAAPPRAARPAKEPADANGGKPLLRGEREMLRALAMFLDDGLTREQLATLAGYAPSGGGFGNYLGSLRGHGFIERVGERFRITEAGIAALGGDVPDRPCSTEELVELWCRKLTGKAKEMLRALVDERDGLSRDELAARVEMEPGGGGFANYLGTLRSNGLIEKRGDRFAASSTLFLGEAV